jgi:hypothetical protein
MQTSSRLQPAGSIRQFALQRARAALALGALLLSVGGLGACSSKAAEEAPSVVEQPVVQPMPAGLNGTSEGLPDRERIKVETGELALPYDQLGELDYTEDFSPRAIDDDYIDEKLRTMAVQRWGAEVDAIIEVKTDLSADSREVNVSAQAVRVRGDCPFCRHRNSTITRQ